ncbi:MAG TPA: hypothetical protein VFA98_11245 [Thermoanaerobaculia bacterium]|nr:hypothetical protein [Thermoanaerobaculia bacterium]
MKPQENTTRRDLPPRCRHPECVAMRAEEFAAMGMTHLAVEVHKSDLPVRCRKTGARK